MVADPPWARVRVLGCPVPPELCAEDARLPVAPPEREQWTEFKQVVREDQMPYVEVRMRPANIKREESHAPLRQGPRQGLALE